MRYIYILDHFALLTTIDVKKRFVGGARKRQTLPPQKRDAFINEVGRWCESYSIPGPVVLTPLLHRLHYPHGLCCIS